MPHAPSQAAAIKCRGAHKYKSYGIVLLFVDAPGGRNPGKQLSAQRLALTMPPNLVSRTSLMRPQIAYSSSRRVLQVWKGLSSSSSSSLVRERLQRHFGKRRFLPGIPTGLAREDTDTSKARLILGINARYTRSSDSNKNLMFREFISNLLSIHIPESSIKTLESFKLSQQGTENLRPLNILMFETSCACVMSFFWKNINNR